MTGLTDYLSKPFDTLYAHTSEETAQYGVYADTRSEESHFSTRSTQSGVSTYAAYEAENVERMPGTVLARARNAYACEEPRTCPDC